MRPFAPVRIQYLTMTLRRNYDESLGQLGRSAGESCSKQEYEILLEFDLKREKEKNLILEQRLRNKEVFIQQMKRFQEELTDAYEKCKNDLVQAQQRLEYLQNVEFREYTEQIADLRHMLLTKNSQESRRESLRKEERPAFASLTHRNGKNKPDKRLPSKSSERRESKTPPGGTLRQAAGDALEEDMRREFKKASNFIRHFLQMAQFYLPELKDEERLSKRMKRSWKWVKDVVKEWDQQGAALKSAQRFKSEIALVFKVNRDVQESILIELIKNQQPHTQN